MKYKIVFDVTVAGEASEEGKANPFRSTSLIVEIAEAASFEHATKMFTSVLQKLMDDKLAREHIVAEHIKKHGVYQTKVSSKLEVVEVETTREVVPMGLKEEEDGDRHYKELAVGNTKHRVFVRGPSGKLFALDAPSELIEEIEGK